MSHAPREDIYVNKEGRERYESRHYTTMHELHTQKNANDIYTHTTHYPPTVVTVAITNPMKHFMLSVDLSLGHPSPLCLSIEDVLLRRQIATPLCRWPHRLRDLIKSAVLAALTCSG